MMEANVFPCTCAVARIGEHALSVAYVLIPLLISRVGSGVVQHHVPTPFGASSMQAAAFMEMRAFLLIPMQTVALLCWWNLGTCWI